jgi:hypothetical protein
MSPPVLVALTSALVLISAGYLLGARAGRSARAALSARLAAETEHRVRLEGRVSVAGEPLPAAQDVRATIEVALAPLLGRERVAHKLAAIRLERTGLSELPAAIDAIAEVGGFQSLVLSDEAGLPIAANTTAKEAELLAGAAAHLQSLAERTVSEDLPRPMAYAVLDEARCTTVHRMFVAGNLRLALSATARGETLLPCALDAALPAVERALAL